MLSTVLSPSVSLFPWPSQALAPPQRHSVAVPSGASRTSRTTERRQMRGAGMTMSMRMLMEMMKKIGRQVEGSLPFHAGRCGSSSQEASGHRSVKSPSSPPCHHLRRRRSLSPIPVPSQRRRSLSPIPVPSHSQRFPNAPLCLNLLLSKGSQAIRGRREMREPPRAQLQGSADSAGQGTGRNRAATGLQAAQASHASGDRSHRPPDAQ